MEHQLSLMQTLLYQIEKRLLGMTKEEFNEVSRYFGAHDQNWCCYEIGAQSTEQKSEPSSEGIHKTGWLN